ncbi:hypothetical protein C2S52_020076 [Perilla frutescens var. hirtella]|uniref:Uncharacterized protein n=1 Tax=Perilla frutescens var. hirtella TaxID=608512 RepID=A0AAD4J3G6_PERFH|nr:hypothetical protein C2S52_020076 [Perilla frutescens var. hirtella]KAH6805714.1 hypothetical protein C2S51_030545 [Perilla frutescens var. frutescens]KAH6826502.1 hypothetical protein C2S53_014715 [Perilla frutescens var. hirtella]
MTASRPQISVLLVIFLVFMEWNCVKITAIRPVEAAEQRLKNKNILVIQSLPRGRVPPSGSNPCTYIPGGRSRGRCAIAVEGEFSSHLAAAPTTST